MDNKPVVEVVRTDSIFCEDRFRCDYGDMTGLIASIKKYGIIQPMAVKRNNDPEKPFRLVAGGRRFDGVRLAQLEEVPVRIYPEGLTDLELRSIELEENIQRKDLTFIEDCNLKREIHHLQVAIHGEKISTAPDASGWSKRDTAELLNKDHKTITMDIKLAEAVESFPDLGWDKCKNKSDAMKVLNKFEERIIRKGLSDRATKLLSKTAKKKTEAYLIGDFFELVKNIPDKSIDLVELDPPYAINLPQQKAKDNYAIIYGDSYNEVDQNQYLEFMSKVFSECYRVMSDDSWLIAWFGPEPWFDIMFHLITDAGFKTRRIPGEWTKPTGQTKHPDTYLASSYEMFFYAKKGNAKINLDKRGRSNLFNFPPVPPAHKIHPTERPVELIEELLSVFAWEGSRVLVPFAGSGNTLIAAYNKKMFPIGYDLSEEYKEGYVSRIMIEEMKKGE